MIRVAEATDIAAIGALEVACFGEEAWSEALLRAEVEGEYRTVLVDEHANDLQAYGSIHLLGDLADLERIAVEPSRRRQGLAAALLSALIQHARERGAARMLLEVADDNTAAVGLYESFGFRTISRRRGYYARDADALIMEREIKEAR
jgi:ribosomal-protein-alanine N-acetyltransferase